jgi:hypothetical protein
VCLIIDANCAASVFSSPIPEDFQPIHEWINKRKGLLVLGGKNKEELFVIEKAKLAIMEWSRKSRASFIDDGKIKAKEIEILREGLLTSNDEHVLALAAVSGAKSLCSPGDHALCADFKNKRIIGNHHRGRIYRNASHANQLSHTPSCHYSRYIKI